MTSTTVLEPKLVEIRIANPKKAGIFTIGPYWDSKNKVYRSLKYASGEDRVFKINGTSTSVININLSDPDDKLLYEFLEHEPRFVDRPEPLIFLKDLAVETDDRISYEEVVFEAKKVVKDLLGTDLANFARLFGIPTENVTEKAVKVAMYELANNDPEHISKVWNDNDRKTKEMLQRGLSKNIFKKDNKGVWRYGEVMMGTNFEQCLMWVKDPENQELIPHIRKEVEEID